MVLIYILCCSWHVLAEILYTEVTIMYFSSTNVPWNTIRIINLLKYEMWLAWSQKLYNPHDSWDSIREAEVLYETSLGSKSLKVRIGNQRTHQPVNLRRLAHPATGMEPWRVIWKYLGKFWSLQPSTWDMPSWSAAGKWAGCRVLEYAESPYLFQSICHNHSPSQPSEINGQCLISAS